MRPFFVSLSLLTTAALAQEPSARDVAAQTRPAVVLVSSIVDGRVAGHGSGFVVSEDGRIVTNRHVIEGAESLRVQLSTGEIYDNVYYVSDDERRDLAIIRIPETGLASLAIGDDRAVEVGDRVYTLGNPLGMEGTFSDGLISAKRTIEGVVMLQITAPISEGSSGGPVLDAVGNVIGVATLTMQDGQNLNMAVPARYARGLLEIGDEPQPFASVAERFSEGSTLGIGSVATAEAEQEEWLRVLNEEMRVLNEAAEKLGYESTHEPVTGMIQQEHTHSFDLVFTEKNAEVKMIGACDIDCSDLDLAVHDLEGNEIVKDILEDDRPEVDFVINSPGKLRISVYMAACSAEPCGFGIQTYQKK